MRRFHLMLIAPLTCASALLGGCQDQAALRAQDVAAQITAFETQVTPLQSAIEAQLRGQPSGLDAASAAQLSRLQLSLGERAAGLQVAERVQLVMPGQVQSVTPELRGLMVLSLPAPTSTGLTWAATLTLDVKAGTVQESVVNPDLGQMYQRAQTAYPPQPGGKALLRFVAGTPGAYPPRVSLGTLSAKGAAQPVRIQPAQTQPAQTQPAQTQALPLQDTATVAEYSASGTLLSVR